MRSRRICAGIAPAAAVIFFKIMRLERRDKPAVD
jgi:hypothetical protein